MSGPSGKFFDFVSENALLDSLCSEPPDAEEQLDAFTLRDALGALFLAFSRGKATSPPLDSQHPEVRRLGIPCVEDSHRVDRVLLRLRDQGGHKWANNHLHSALRGITAKKWVCDLQILPIEESDGIELHAVSEGSQGKWLDIQVPANSEKTKALSPSWDFLFSLPDWKRPSFVRGGEGFCTEENLAAAEAFGVDFIFPLPPIAPFFVRRENRWTSRHESRVPLSGITRLPGWSRERRVLFLKSGVVVASSGLSISVAERLAQGRPLSQSWPQVCWGGSSPECMQIFACLFGIFQNWWSDFEAGRPPNGALFIHRAVLFRSARKFSQELAAVILILIATGIAFTANPGPAQPPPPTQNAAESDADFLLAPMQPAEPDAGFQTIEAATEYPIAPLPDPNVDDVPPLDGEQLGLIEIPEEADDRIWRIRPIVATGVTYDDNIFITNTDRKGDLIYNINLGFALEVGDYRTMESNFLLLEYLAEGFFFNRYASQNSFDQQASLLAQYRLNQLAIQFESRYQYLNGAEREVGAFTTRSLYFNALRFLFQYSEKTELSAEVSQAYNDYPNNLSSAQYEANFAFDYLLFPKTKLGLLTAVGLQPTEGSPDMWYQSLQARLDYRVTGKMFLNASGGLQLNQYVDGGEPMRAVPVFSLGCEYQLFPKTMLSLVGYRNLQSSPSLAAQDYIATGGEIGVAQQITEKLIFELSAGYENDTYVANVAKESATRVDNFYFARPAISYSFLKYVKATLSYEYRANDSTLQADTWFDNQFVFDLEGNF